MDLYLHNTLTRQREPFTPADPARVTMYVCGPTVYNFAHIGNARPPVVFDLLARLLRRRWPRVVYARNITDVDDKINAAASELGVPISVITERYTARLSRRPRRTRRRPARHRAARHRQHRRDRRHDRAPARSGPRLRRRRPRAVRGGDVRRLRQAVRPLDRRDGRRRPCGGRAVQALPRRLRAVEAVLRRPARLGLALGPRAARLAHRVLGDERGAPRRDDRHPRRRRGSRVPAPRERDRAEHLRAWRRAPSRATGCTTASSPSTARRCRSRWATPW